MSIFKSKGKAQAQEIERLRLQNEYLRAQIAELKGLLAQAQGGSVPPDVVRFMQEWVVPKMNHAGVDLRPYDQFLKWLEAQP